MNAADARAHMEIARKRQKDDFLDLISGSIAEAVGEGKGMCTVSTFDVNRHDILQEAITHFDKLGYVVTQVQGALDIRWEIS